MLCGTYPTSTFSPFLHLRDRRQQQDCRRCIKYGKEWTDNVTVKWKSVYNFWKYHQRWRKHPSITPLTLYTLLKQLWSKKATGRVIKIDCQLSSPLAKRAAPKGLRAESARAGRLDWRRLFGASAVFCFLFTKTAVTRKKKVEKIDPIVANWPSRRGLLTGHWWNPIAKKAFYALRYFCHKHTYTSLICYLAPEK